MGEKFKIVTGGGEEGPEEIGPYNAVKTKVALGIFGEKEVYGHNLGKHEEMQVFLSTLERRIRRLFDGLPETMKPVLRPLDNYYAIYDYPSFHIVADLEKVEDTPNNLNIPEPFRRERPDAINILVAGLLRAKYVYMPVGIGYGMGARAGELVPKTVAVFILRDKFDNLILSCFNYEFYKQFNRVTNFCWMENIPYPVWPKILVF